MPTAPTPTRKPTASQSQTPGESMNEAELIAWLESKGIAFGPGNLVEITGQLKIGGIVASAPDQQLSFAPGTRLYMDDGGSASVKLAADDGLLKCRGVDTVSLQPE